MRNRRISSFLHSLRCLVDFETRLFFLQTMTMKMKMTTMRWKKMMKKRKKRKKRRKRRKKRKPVRDKMKKFQPYKAQRSSSCCT